MNAATVGGATALDAALRQPRAKHRAEIAAILRDELGAKRGATLAPTPPAGTPRECGRHYRHYRRVCTAEDLKEEANLCRRRQNCQGVPRDQGGRTRPHPKCDERRGACPIVARYQDTARCSIRDFDFDATMDRCIRVDREGRKEPLHYRCRVHGARPEAPDLSTHEKAMLWPFGRETTVGNVSPPPMKGGFVRHVVRNDESQTDQS